MPLLLFLYFSLFLYLAWRNITFALLFIIFALPSYLIRFQIGFIPMTVLEGMILIVFSVWLFQKVKNYKLSKIWNFGHWNFGFIWNLEFGIWNFVKNSLLGNPILLFLLAATISVLVSPTTRAALGIWKAYFIEPIMFFLILTDVINKTKNKDRIRDTILIALGLSALTVSTLAIYQKFTGWMITNPFWQAEATRRVTSFYGYPNAIGLYLGPIIVLYFGWLVLSVKSGTPKFSLRKIWQYLFQTTVITASILSIIFSQTEAAWIAVTIGIIIFFFIIYFYSRSTLNTPHSIFHSPPSTFNTQHSSFHVQHSTFRLLILIVFIIILLAIPVTSQTNFSSLAQKLTLSDTSGKIRKEIWKETIQMLKNRPFLGAGLAGYQKTIEPYHQAKHIEIYLYPHNLFLNFWSEMGMLGLLTFIWLVIRFFSQTISQIKNQKSKIKNQKSYPMNRETSASFSLPFSLIVLSAFISLLIHGLVDVPYFKNDLAILFWLLIALGNSY